MVKRRKIINPEEEKGGAWPIENDKNCFWKMMKLV